MNNAFEQAAVARVQSYLHNYDTAEPCEIIADLMHYCRCRDINFLSECLRAEGYVEEELSMDA